MHVTSNQKQLRRLRRQMTDSLKRNIGSTSAAAANREFGGVLTDFAERGLVFRRRTVLRSAAIAGGRLRDFLLDPPSRIRVTSPDVFASAVIVPVVQRCPTCGAAGDEPCKTKTGGKAKQRHSARPA